MAGRNDEEVRILVTAKDEASKTLANVGDSMGGLAKKAGGMGSAMSRRRSARSRAGRRSIWQPRHSRG